MVESGPSISRYCAWLFMDMIFDATMVLLEFMKLIEIFSAEIALVARPEV